MTKHGSATLLMISIFGVLVSLGIAAQSRGILSRTSSVHGILELTIESFKASIASRLTTGSICQMTLSPTLTLNAAAPTPVNQLFLKSAPPTIPWISQNQIFQHQLKIASIELGAAPPNSTDLEIPFKIVLDKVINTQRPHLGTRFVPLDYRMIVSTNPANRITACRMVSPTSVVQGTPKSFCETQLGGIYDPSVPAPHPKCVLPTIENTSLVPNPTYGPPSPGSANLNRVFAQSDLVVEGEVIRKIQTPTGWNQEKLCYADGSLNGQNCTPPQSPINASGTRWTLQGCIAGSGQVPPPLQPSSGKKTLSCGNDMYLVDYQVTLPSFGRITSQFRTHERVTITAGVHGTNAAISSNDPSYSITGRCCKINFY